MSQDQVTALLERAGEAPVPTTPDLLAGVRRRLRRRRSAQAAAALVLAVAAGVGGVAATGGTPPGPARLAQRPPAPVRAMPGPTLAQWAKARWTRLERCPLGDQVAAMVWDGHSVLALDGQGRLAVLTGRTWRLGPSDPIGVNSAVWAGGRLVTWTPWQVAAFDPATGRWRRLGAPPPENGELVAAGRAVAFMAAAGRRVELSWLPAGSPDWHTTYSPSLPAGPSTPSATWTGSELVVVADGLGRTDVLRWRDGRWQPPSRVRTPGATAQPGTLVWTGSTLVAPAVCVYCAGQPYQLPGYGEALLRLVGTRWSQVLPGGRHGVGTLVRAGTSLVSLGPPLRAVDPVTGARSEPKGRAPQELTTAVWTGHALVGVSGFTGDTASLTPAR